MRSKSASSGGSWVRLAGRVSVVMILPLTYAGVTVLRGPQPLPDDRVEMAVRGEAVAAVDTAMPIEVGHATARLFDEEDRRGRVPALEADLDHRLGRALGEQRVAPEIAEAPLAPDIPEQRIEAGGAAGLGDVDAAAEQDLGVVERAHAADADADRIGIAAVPGPCPATAVAPPPL